MGQTERHDKRDCECLKYTPQLKIWELRLDGINYLCRKCNRLVDPAKWHGGIIHFSNRSRFVKQNECPCCGRRMSTKRKAKKKLEDSVEHQKKNGLDNTIAHKALKKKILLIENDILVPRVK